MQKNIVNLRTLRRTTGILLVLLAIACALPGISSNDVFAQDGVDSAALAKEIDKNLRAAERDMFSGKNESADQQLQAIAGQRPDAARAIAVFGLAVPAQPVLQLPVFQVDAAPFDGSPDHVGQFLEKVQVC